MYLGSSPLLRKPTPAEDLYLYLAVANETVEAVLVREKTVKPESNTYYNYFKVWTMIGEMI